MHEAFLHSSYSLHASVDATLTATLTSMQPCMLCRVRCKSMANIALKSLLLPVRINLCLPGRGSALDCVRGATVFAGLSLLATSSSSIRDNITGLVSTQYHGPPSQTLRLMTPQRSIAAAV